MRLLLTLLILILAPLASPAQVVVSHFGNDAGPGTFAEPFATPARAQEAVRLLRKQHPDRGVVVLLRRGVYRLSKPLHFGPEDGGNANADVIWTILPGEHVIFSGGVEINDWTEDSDGFLRAKLPAALAGQKINDVYFNHQRLTLARYPNQGEWLRVDKAGQDRRTSFTFSDPSASENSSNTDGLFVHLLHDWSTSRVPVAEIDWAKGYLKTHAPIGCRAPHYAIDNFEPHPRFALEGLPMFLDERGEWALDATSGELVVVPPDSLPEMGFVATAQSMHAEIPRLQQLIKIKGTKSNPVRNLHFIGIQFQHADFTPPIDGWAGAQASMHERRDGSAQASERIFAPAAIQVEFAQNCSLESCHLSQIGGSGIWLGRGCKDTALRLCSFQDIGANGINIGDDSSRLVDGQPWWKSSDLQDPQLARKVRVEGCFVSKVGARYGGGVGIWIGFAAECEIAFNHIQYTPYTGLSVGWVWSPEAAPSGGHIIEKNEIENTMQLLSDGGCIYTLGRQPGTVIRGNHLHHVPRHAGRAPSNGIFIDEGTTGISIEGNWIHDIGHAPIRFHRSGKNRITGNVLITEMESPYYYNRAKPEDIEFVDNQVRPASIANDFKIGHDVGPRWLLWYESNPDKK
ncbi:MAG: right-handed parallel beta-helix repeat-containing protein [Planctomycetes bacterium]|nr:right-handed parallel beta-helix repeat-containing protein [Planctomycetota bacterium]